MEDKIAVSCPTKEIWNTVVKELQRRFPEYDCSKFSEGHWKINGVNSCISEKGFASGNPGFTDRSSWEEHGYKIISAQEYLNEGGKDVSEFKAGDRVRCISAAHGLIRGEIYTVNHVRDGHIALKELDPDSATIFAYRFKLATKTQTTKENKMNTNISEVFDKTKDALLVEKHLGAEIGTTFIEGLILADKKTEVLAEAKRLEKEEKDNK